MSDLIKKAAQAIEAVCYPPGRSFDPCWIEVTPEVIAQAAFRVFVDELRANKECCGLKITESFVNGFRAYVEAFAQAHALLTEKD